MKKTLEKTFICPLCRNIVTEYPALSRRDNKMEICSKCGMREAIQAMRKRVKRNGSTNS